MKTTTKRDRFFAASLQLIHEKGFKATTMRDIAHKLNFEVANVYNYIDSKQSLLETYIFDLQDEFHDAIDAILDSTYSPKEKLRLTIASYIQITAKRPYEQALLVNEWRNLKEPRLQEFIERRKAYVNKVKTIIDSGVAKKEFRQLDVDISTQTILASLRWVYLRFIEDKTSVNSVELEKQLCEFILTAIIKN